MLKKLIALICTLSLLAGIAPLQAMAAADAKGSAQVTEDGFGYVIQDDQTVCIVAFPEDVEDLVIPSEIDGLPVTVIDSNPKADFWTCKKYENYKSIYIPDSLEEICGFAFYGCSQLNNVTFPDKLIRIYGKDVFGDTPWFAKQTPQNGMTIIGRVLLDASGTTGAVEIPDSVEMIGCDALGAHGYVDLRK